VRAFREERATQRLRNLFVSSPSGKKKFNQEKEKGRQAEKIYPRLMPRN